MAYYYISSTGTATGDAGRYATLQTGTSAAVASYATLAAMLLATTPEVAGDYVVFFDDYTGTDTAFSSLANGVFMISVSALNGSLSRRSGFYPAITFTTVNFDYLNISGLKFVLSTDTRFENNVVHSDCYFDYDLSETAWVAITDGASVRADNCTIFTGADGLVCSVSRGGSINIDSLTLDASVGNGVSRFTDGGFVFGGGSLVCTNSDLATIDDTLIKNVGSSVVGDDMINVRFDNCKLATGVAFTNETFNGYNQRALFTRCSDVSAEAEYQYALCCFGGGADIGGGAGVVDTTAIYRNEDTAFTESNQKISYEITTNADASLGFPLWLDFPMSQYVPLTTTSTLEFYITCATALTDKDIYITVGYTDATNKNTTNNVISAPATVGGTLDLLAAGTTLTTDATSTWTGGLANVYKIVIDCPTGADCQPTVKINVTKPSTTLYIASEYGVS